VESSEMALWRKVSSTTAEKTYYPINLMNRLQYWIWTIQYPFGMLDMKTSDIIQVYKPKI
jgi:hypothetical protein